MKIACPPPRRPVTPSAEPPSFSVVIAAYQAADVIVGAVASALAQEPPPLEVIVCDDGSTDDLASALAPVADRIVVLHQENRGEGSAKNAGARAARGDYVAILDADDAYLPGRLAALGELARIRPDLAILTTDAFLEAGGRRVRTAYGPAWPFEVDDQRAEILRRNFIFGHVAVQREALLAAGGFDEAIRRTTDWACWVRMILNGASAGAVLEPLALYRVTETGLSADRAAMLEGSLQTLRAALAHPGLTAADRVIAEASIAARTRELAPMRLSRAVRERAPGVRSDAMRLACARGTPWPTRLKAAAAAIAPGAVRRVLNRREERSWVGAGGTRLERG